MEINAPISPDKVVREKLGCRNKREHHTWIAFVSHNEKAGRVLFLLLHFDAINRHQSAQLQAMRFLLIL